MNIYLKYLKYVLEHKKNVFKVAWKGKQYLHAITHDLSKFHPKEFIPYAEYFYGDYNPNSPNKNGFISDAYKITEVKLNFDKAWQHHKDNNKHHWDYWYERNIPMPVKYIKQMIIDWTAMSLKFSDTPQEFYFKNYNKIKFADDNVTFGNSRHILELNLDLLKYNAPLCECNYEVYMSIKQLIEDSEKYFEKNGHCGGTDVKTHIDDLFKYINEQYNVSVYDIVKNM